jgi:hypothetical protein
MILWLIFFMTAGIVLYAFSIAADKVIWEKRERGFFEPAYIGFLVAIATLWMVECISK